MNDREMHQEFAVAIERFDVAYDRGVAGYTGYTEGAVDAAEKEWEQAERDLYQLLLNSRCPVYRGHVYILDLRNHGRVQRLNTFNVEVKPPLKLSPSTLPMPGK